MRRFLSDERGSGEAELLGIIMLLAMVVALGYGAVMGIREWCCSTPPSPLEKWVGTQHHRCKAMRSRLTVGASDPNTVECWRTPFMRKSHLQFRETFKGE